MTTGYDEQWLAAYQRKRAVSPPAAITTVRLILPFPPTVNHNGADGFRGGRKTDAYKAFLAEVAARVVDQGSPLIEGRLFVSIEVVSPDKRARDLDNLCKATLDALAKAGLYEDDAQIDDLRIRRYPCNVPGEGSACVTVTRISE